LVNSLVNLEISSFIMFFGPFSGRSKRRKVLFEGSGILTMMNKMIMLWRMIKTMPRKATCKDKTLDCFNNLYSVDLLIELIGQVPNRIY
jgi:hypothetical protein